MQDKLDLYTDYLLTTVYPSKQVGDLEQATATGLSNLVDGAISHDEITRLLSKKDRNAGQWTRIDALDIPDNTPVKVWLKDLKIPVLLIK
jgi:hypothetical protein